MAISRIFFSGELWLNLGDGVDQAADLASGATSIPERVNDFETAGV